MDLLKIGIQKILSFHSQTKQAGGFLNYENATEKMDRKSPSKIKDSRNNK